MKVGSGIIAILSAMFLLAIEAASASHEAAIHIRVERDEREHSSDGLLQKELEIRIDGVPTTVTSMSSAARPLNVVLVLDATSKMANTMAPFFEDSQEDPISSVVHGSSPPRSSLSLFLDAVDDGVIQSMRPGDRLRVATIAGRVRMNLVPEGRRAATRRTIVEALKVPENDRFRSAPLWDALAAATQAVESEPGQKAILLVSDGVTTGNEVGFSEMLDRAIASHVSISVVREVVSIPLGRARLMDKTDNPWFVLANAIGDQPDVTLRRLADVSGGEYIEDGHAGERALGKHLKTVTRRLQRMWTVTFSAPDDDAVHSLDVRVRGHGDWTVIAPRFIRASRSF